LNDLFKTDSGRRRFTQIVHQTIKEVPSLTLSDNSFELLLYLINTTLQQMDLSDSKDLISAKVLMHSSCALNRKVDDRQEFIQDYIKIYEIWKNLKFWDDYFWDELVKKHKKRYGDNISDVDCEMTSTLILHFAYNMLNWGVQLENIYSFAKDMAKKKYVQGYRD